MLGVSSSQLYRPRLPRGFHFLDYFFFSAAFFVAFAERTSALLAAALRAILLRSSGVNASARFRPPLLPSSRATSDSFLSVTTIA